MRGLRLHIFFYLLILVPNLCNAQGIRLQVKTNTNEETLRKLNYRSNFNNRKEISAEIDNLITSLQYRGYLLASVDSIGGDSLLVKAWINPGEIFKTARLGIGNLNPTLASKLNISEKLYLNKPFNYRAVASMLNKIIVYYENNGYPFASVKLDSVRIEGNSLSAVLNAQPNKLYKLDSIKVIGNAKINSSYLNRYLSIKEGMLYNEANFAAIQGKIRQLPFVTEKQPQRVQLTPRTNKLLLFLDKKDASQFDGIIGVLPDANTKKTVITGDVKLKLVNGILHNGETFDLEWRRLQTQTQDFNGRVIYPYMFKTPLGTDYALKIYRKDTTFIDINNNIGLQYYFSALNNFKVFYRQRNSNLISTSGLENAAALPEYADVITQAYGMGASVEKLDYRFNPHKGLLFVASTQTGNRQIKKNPAINPLLYDEIVLRSTQYQLELNTAYYIQLHRDNVLKIGLQASSVFGNQGLFRNELFRIGGLKTLRGFDEESIYASTYVIPTIEYRFLFAKNSNLLLFAEGAWYENTSNHQYLKDTPMSFGGGVNFETKAGILSLNYGIGKQMGNTFDFRSGKIHFGLTALF